MKTCTHYICIQQNHDDYWGNRLILIFIYSNERAYGVRTLKNPLQISKFDNKSNNKDRRERIHKKKRQTHTHQENELREKEMRRIHIAFGVLWALLDSHTHKIHTNVEKFDSFNFVLIQRRLKYLKIWWFDHKCSSFINFTFILVPSAQMLPKNPTNLMQLERLIFKRWVIYFNITTE